MRIKSAKEAAVRHALLPAMPWSLILLLSDFEDGVGRKHSTEVRERIDDAVPSDEAAWADDAVAADLCMITNDRAELLQTGARSFGTIFDDHFTAV